MVNNAAVNMAVHRSLYILFLFSVTIYLKVGLGGSIFHFLRKLRVVFHGGSTNVFPGVFFFANLP